MKKFICLAVILQLAQSAGYCAPEGAYAGKGEVYEGYGQLLMDDDTHENIVVDGAVIRVTGDGKFEDTVVGAMEREQDLVRDGIVTDIRDPRLAELLRDHRRMERMRKASAGTGDRPVEAAVDWGRGWLAASAPFIAPMWGLMLNNPNLDEVRNKRNYIEISKGVRENGDYAGTVRISARAGVFYQTIFADFDPETGEIRGGTLKEILIVRRK